jgi:hypothetical protein
VGWFDRRAKDAHRRALLDAAQLVKQYRIAGTHHFDLTSVPEEFRTALQPRLGNLLRHVETTSDKDLGDGSAMRELGEDLGFAHVLCSGETSQETRRNFRTVCFDAAVESLADMLENPDRFRDSAAAVLESRTLEDRIRWLETTLGWFSDRPAPASTKYSADQGRTILALAKKALETAREVDKVKASSVRPTTHRACPACGKRNDLDASFCKFCGSALARRCCTACGTQQDPDALFCKRCGGRTTT